MIETEILEYMIDHGKVTIVDNTTQTVQGTKNTYTFDGVTRGKDLHAGDWVRIVRKRGHGGLLELIVPEKIEIPHPPIFVKWTCGCIGFLLRSDPPEAPKAYVIKGCEEGDYGTPHDRSIDLLTKRFTPLIPEEFMALVKDIMGLVCDGERFREVRWLLTGHIRNDVPIFK